MSRNALKTVQSMFPQVTSVVDAGRARVIEVEAVDLQSAAVRSHRTCAMAVACKRKLELDGVIMARTTAYLIKGRRATRYAVPQAVTREIISFDRGGGFEPGIYRLIPFEAGRRLGADKARGPHEIAGQPQRFRHQTAGVRAMLGSRVPAAEA